MNTQQTTKSDQSLTFNPFAAKPTLIPLFDDNKVFTGEPFRIDQVLYRSLEGGARMHFWLHPDKRPHNHPWEFIACRVLRGGYTAIEYYLNRSGYGENYLSRTVFLTPDCGEHILWHGEYHQVSAIIPGTISIMTFGKTMGDGKQWGNLVRKEAFKDTGNGDTISEFYWEKEQADILPDYLNAFRHLNPHLRPTDWQDPYSHMEVPTVEELVAKFQEMV